MPDISITNNTVFKINDKKAKKIIEHVLERSINKPEDYEFSLVITNDRTIKKLNKIYRGKNEPTDILAFPGEGNFLGEILIDYEQIRRQAKEYRNTAHQEFVFILIHGLLHLEGMDDDTPPKKKAMIKLGEKYFKELKAKKLL